MEVMGAPRKHPDEVRDRAVRLVRDLVDSGEDGVTLTGACRRVVEQLGINTDTLRNWVKPALVDDSERSGLSTSERARLAELEREVVDVLGQAGAAVSEVVLGGCSKRPTRVDSLTLSRTNSRLVRARMTT